MKNRKSYYSLLLALALCLCLTACGGSGDTIDDGGEDYSGNEVNTPDSFEGMVKDSELGHLGRRGQQQRADRSDG